VFLDVNAKRPGNVALLPGMYVVRLHLPSHHLREIQATVHEGETTPVLFGPR